MSEEKPKTTAEEIAEDAKWLRELAHDLPDSDYTCDSEAARERESKRLDRIADKVEMMSVAMFEPSLLLEQKAESVMAKVVGVLTEGDNVETEDCQLIQLWLIQRTLKENGRKAVLTKGLGSVASLLTGLAKHPPKAPLDPDDKG